MSEIQGRKCFACGEVANGYAVAGHVKKKSNAAYFCKNEECKEFIGTLCRCMNTMNRRLKDGPLYPATKEVKATKKRKAQPARPSECQRLFKIYKKRWKPELDTEFFPHPDGFEARGVTKI